MASGKKENKLKAKPEVPVSVEEKPEIKEDKVATEEIKGEKKSKPKDKEKKKKDKNDKQENIHTDGKVKTIVGILFMCLAIFLGISFISYLVSFFGAHHQEYGDQIFNKGISIDGSTGSLGVWFSQILIKESFGIGAFFFVYLLTIIGAKLFINTKIRMWNIWKYALLGLVWFPLFFAFIPAKSCAILGGAAGLWMKTNLLQYIGNTGIILVLVFTGLIYAIYEFNLTFNYLRRLREKKAEKEAAAEVTKDNEDDVVEKDSIESVTEINTESKNPIAEEEKEEDLPPVTAYTKGPEMEIVTPVEEPKRKENVMVRTPKEPEPEPEPIEEADVVEIPAPVVEIPVETPPTEPESEVALVIEKIEEEKTVEKGKDREHHTLDTPFDPRFELRDFKFPSLDLLNDYGGKKSEINSEELEANKNKIVETLANYGIAIDKIKATIGPTVTLYEIVPAAGVRISKIKNLEDDIALSLAALGIRIIAPIPGKGTIGIEVPNSKPETVSMKSVLSSEKFQNSKYALPCAIGKTISNETYVFDLAKMPHILMAGATGQGKSVGLNAIVASLLYSKHPAELKFVMVDPKKVELTLYNRIERHYLAKLPDSEDAIITDVKKVVRTLNSLCVEMDQRYDLLKQAECRNIIEYNEKFKSRRLLPTEGHRFLPYIVLIVDEFADLIMTAGRDVEAPIARLAQLARAIGIHLIIATQRPSVNVITGSIKANFPARIAFRVISTVDSKTILDGSGANQLIGRGDMLISTGNDIVRLQCAFIDTPEVESVTEFIGAQRGYSEPFLLPEVPDEEGTSLEIDDDMGERDSLFEEAAHIVVQTQQGSTSMIQRKLKLGYNRAGRIIDQLEAAGIVGPFSGSKSREVKVADEFALEQILQDIYNKDHGI